MSYLYETHLHTVQASACGHSRGADYISFYKEKGYTGIIVTDLPVYLFDEKNQETYIKDIETIL